MPNPPLPRGEMIRYFPRVWPLNSIALVAGGQVAEAGCANVHDCAQYNPEATSSTMRVRMVTEESLGRNAI